MTKDEWLACDDPTPMLEYVRRRAGDRRLPLFGCACCRRVWPADPGPDVAALRRAAETVADGAAGDAARERARRSADALTRSGDAARESLAWELWAALGRRP